MLWPLLPPGYGYLGMHTVRVSINGGGDDDEAHVSTFFCRTLIPDVVVAVNTVSAILGNLGQHKENRKPGTVIYCT